MSDPRNESLPIKMSDEYWRNRDHAGHYYDHPMQGESDVQREIVDRAIKGDEKCITLLLNPDRVNKSMVYGDYPIHVVSVSDNVKLLADLVKHGVPINTTDSENRTGLHYAASAGKIECIKVLVELGADINYQNKNHMTPLISATENDKNEAVEELIKLGADVMIQNDLGTALHIASLKGHVSIAKILVQKIPVDTLNSKNHSALHSAALNDKSKIIEVLAKAGADLNLKDNDGDTPIMSAICLGNMDVVKDLLKLGAQIDSKNNKGQSLIHLAVKSPGVPTQLKKLNIDLNSKDTNGYTALHTAALEGGKDIIEELITLGVDKNAVDVNGNTALHLAAEKNRIEVARQLLKMNVKTDIKNNDGNTAGQVAHTILAKEITSQNNNNDTSHGSGITGFFSNLFKK